MKVRIRMDWPAFSKGYVLGHVLAAALLVLAVLWNELFGEPETGRGAWVRDCVSDAVAVGHSAAGARADCEVAARQVVTPGAAEEDR